MTDDALILLNNIYSSDIPSGPEQKSLLKQTIDLLKCAEWAHFARFTEQDGQQAFLRAYHEAKNCHEWVASQEDCDICGKGPCGWGG